MDSAAFDKLAQHLTNLADQVELVMIETAKNTNRSMATKPQDGNAQEQRVAEALAAMSIAELRKLVSEMEAELRQPLFKVVN